VDERQIRKFSYVPGLDGVRAVAVLLIIAAHTYEQLLPRGGSAFVDPYWTPVPGAVFGVDIFFALSGFLITALLYTEYATTGRIDFRSFYIRRALRLLPALIAVLIATTLYVVVTNDPLDDMVPSLLPVLFYCANWMPILGVTVSPLLLHTWSLSVEEQFYILWPAIVGWWWFRRGRALTGLVGGYLCVSFAYRFHVLFGDANHFLLYLNTLARADPLVIGALGAYLWATRPAPRRVGVLAWPAIFLAIWLVGHHGDLTMMQLIGWTLIGVATTMVIVAIVDGWRGGAVLAWTPLRAIGRVSYGIYLWHAPVFVIVMTNARSWSPLARVLVAYSVTTVVVLVSWFCIERPFLALKPRPRPRVQPPPLDEVSPAPVAGA